MKLNMNCHIPEITPWHDPALENYFLDEGEVHVWKASLCELEAQVPWLNGLLTDSERARALRYRFESNRQQFIVGRGLLRVLLGRYLGHDAASRDFNYNHSGKPLLGPEFARHDLSFNISHSNDLVLISLGRNRDVGIDVEYMDEKSDMLRVAMRYFTPRELQSIQEQEPYSLDTAYFRHWCYKEALAKGIGENLFQILSEMEILGGEAVEDWSLLSLPDPADDYVAAVAVHGDCRRLACLSLTKESPLFYKH